MLPLAVSFTSSGVILSSVLLVCLLYDFVTLFIERFLGFLSKSGLLIGLSFLFTSVGHHSFEIFMIVNMGLGFLFLHFLSLFTLSFDSTLTKGFSGTAVINKDWPIIEVVKSRDLVDDSLTIVLDLLGALVFE